MFRFVSSIFLQIGFACLLSSAWGQSAPVPVHPDHTSAEAAVAALYDVISGPVGQARDWDRFKALFVPGARMFAVAKRPDGSMVHVPMTPDDYITRSGKVLVENGFVESELGYEQQQFGNVVHRWSAYEGKLTGKPEAKPIRGVNSIQLISDGKRWYVLSVLWQAEDEVLKLPKRLSKKLKQKSAAK